MHPFVSILYFFFVLIAMGVVSEVLLSVLFVLLSTLALVIRPKQFLVMVIRLKWIFLSILMIYAYATPGEFVSYLPATFAPTIEGLYQGALQVMRLSSALATMTLLLMTSSKVQLISALYMLCRPLKYLGCNVERLAVRLVLTLEYVDEIALHQRHAISFDRLDELNAGVITHQKSKMVNIEDLPFHTADKMLLLLLMLLIATFIFIKLLH
ncbi:MAG: hypothetical protein FJY53_04960 [Betaproteobacteria bacterium]|nr:hypothetical protein [Betaproteobacteria bacterium]